MQIVDPQKILGKKVLLRYDIDVALRQEPDGLSSQGKLVVGEEFKLKAGLETLRLCIDNASKVIIIGHVGRPFKTAADEKAGNPVELSAKPIHEWLEKELGQKIDYAATLEDADKSNNKLVLLENIRFFHGEEMGPIYHASCTSKTCDIDFAKKLAALGDVYINEAFSSYRPAVSTTVLPTLLPHAVGLHFQEETETLLNVRNNPKKPFIAFMGGAKVSEKVAVIQVLAQKADAVLVGGKLIHEIREQNVDLPKNVMVGKLNEDGFDISEDTSSAWAVLIKNAAQIIWNGPLGKFEDEKYNQTQKVLEAMLDSSAELIIGGGDSIAALNQYGLLKKAESKAFVSVGGGAMLKLISDGTLPTIEALK